MNIKSLQLKPFRSIIVAVMLLCGFSAFSQKDSTAGQFSLGMRSTISSFTDAGSVGIGAGGQFWIRVTKHMNTEWYADYITTNIQNLGYRNDGHIGWSVIFYTDKDPLMVHKITPFFLAGQCFDYTKVYSDYLNTDAERWSAAAAQGGLGITYKITKQFDFSAIVQYMMHLGTHIDSEILTDDYGIKYLSITHDPGASLDGHLLINFSVNYMLGRL
jgi:hypothetical protein